MPGAGENEAGKPSDVPNYGEYRISQLMDEIHDTTDAQLLRSMRDTLMSAQQRDPYNQQISQAIILLNAHCHNLITFGILSPHSLEESSEYPLIPDRERITGEQRRLTDVAFREIITGF